METSSLETWLKGENPCLTTKLAGSVLLNDCVENPDEVVGEGQAFTTVGEWWVDVLDDGTAITYYPFET